VVTGDGAIEQFAGLLGSQTNTGGTDRDSQKIAFTSYNAANTQFRFLIFGDHLGGAAFRAGGSGGSFAFQDPTGATNWFSIAVTGFGYPTGMGGAVTQATSKSAAVTLNKVCGQITLHNAALAAGASVSFTLNNSMIAATDEIDPWIVSGATADSYSLGITAVAAGTCRFQLRNFSVGSLGEALVVGFSVKKAKNV
jgi:hypothetical protein